MTILTPAEQITAEMARAWAAELLSPEAVARRQEMSRQLDRVEEILDRHFPETKVA